MDFKSAKEMAEKHYAESGATVTKIYEADDRWIFYAEKNGMVPIGEPGLTVSKDSGMLGHFILPDRENFAILKSAKLVFDGKREK